jgi:adenylate cyclase
MFTDMVGYTSLGQRNESLSLALVDEQRKLIRPVIARHGGFEVKTIGDAFLVTFPSAVDAALCSYDIQRATREFNFSVAPDRRIHLRIGIHIGEVVEDGGDILGDAVNVASRINGLARDGGVCMTRQVYDQVENKIDLRLSSMGLTELKNVSAPVEVFQMVMPWESHQGPGGEPGEATRIAVLPLANMSPDPKDEYFADGLTEELISRMSKVAGLQVISRTSAMHFKNSKETTKQIATELGARSILEGSVRKAGDKVRVTVQLIDGRSDIHMWGESYDRRMEDVFDIQEDIAGSVVESLKVKLLPVERARVHARETQNVAAYVAYLKGRALLREGTEASTRDAKEQFEGAIKEDAAYAKAYAGLADTIMTLGDYLFAPIPNALQVAKDAVHRALELDPDLAEARVSLANILTYDYRFRGAELEFKKAIELNPSYATAHLWYSACLQSLGRGEEALEEAFVAERLDPLSPAITLSVVYRTAYRGLLGEAEKRLKRLEEIDPGGPLLDEARMVMAFARKDWAEALLCTNKMKERDPVDPYLDADLGYVYAVTGRRDEALQIIDKLKGVPENLRIKGNLLAWVYAGLGDLDSAFEWLFRAAEWKESFSGWIISTPFFERVRADPRFGDLLRRMGVEG